MVDQHGGFSPSSFRDRVLAKPKQKNNLQINSGDQGNVVDWNYENCVFHFNGSFAGLNCKKPKITQTSTARFNFYEKLLCDTSMKMLTSFPGPSLSDHRRRHDGSQ